MKNADGTPAVVDWKRGAGDPAGRLGPSQPPIRVY
jgi:hypothetical protein